MSGKPAHVEGIEIQMGEAAPAAAVSHLFVGCKGPLAQAPRALPRPQAPKGGSHGESNK